MRKKHQIIEDIILDIKDLANSFIGDVKDIPSIIKKKEPAPFFKKFYISEEILYSNDILLGLEHDELLFAFDNIEKELYMLDVQRNKDTDNREYFWRELWSIRRPKDIFQSIREAIIFLYRKGNYTFYKLGVE